ncbi:MAG: radical SAM protein [Proteobacteria bacterium]|jgi:MoaA/NifB/PqqE/SkfB family radical SAM enzyme|nr:radical SAM protein [Pseudomonadota bacterium]
MSLDLPPWFEPLAGEGARASGNERLSMEPPPQFPAAMVNVTNRCNLACKHCFVYREGNPNSSEDEMAPAEMLRQLKYLRDRHGIKFMLWMGGEPSYQRT